MQSNSKYDNLLQKLSIKYDKPIDVIRKIIESQYGFINKEIKNIDFKNIETKEQFDNTKKTFLVRYLFKLTPSWSVLKRYNDLRKLKGEENDKRKESSNTSN